MKRIILFAVLLTLSLASFARIFICEGKSNSDLGDYKIEIADSPLVLNGKDLTTFVISYQNTKMEVKIAIAKKRSGMTYYVLSDPLSIKYTCNGKYFGVSLLGKELEADGYFTSESALNKSQYYHQKVIAGGGKCDLEYSKLIACFFPSLLNNVESIISES